MAATKKKRVTKKQQMHLDILREEYAKLKRNAQVSATAAEWEAEVKKLAMEAAVKAKLAAPTPNQWIEAARTATTKCDKCGGTGTYVWGAIVNGNPTHSGPCFRCQGKGRQGQADYKRNWGHNQHLRVV